MNNAIAYFFFFLLLSFPALPQSSNVKAYSGRIGKFPIGMELTVKNGEVTGRYCYRNKWHWLNLRGNLKGVRIYFVENEPPVDELSGGKTTGSFEGMIQPDSTITGVWKSVDGTKSFPFALTRERFGFSPGSIAIQQEKYSNAGCECFEGNVIRITDQRLSNYMYCKLSGVLNAAAISADRECPCWEMESGGTQGSTEEMLEIVYNKHNLLTYRLTSSATGAYSWTRSDHWTIDLRTGEFVYAQTFFKPESLVDIRKFVVDELSKEVESTIKSLESKDEQRIVREECDRKLAELKSEQSLYPFMITDSTFVFDVNWGFHHVAAALSPSGEVILPNEKLAAWIEPKGPLNFFLEKK